MRFTLRDLFWLTAVVGLSIGWWLDHRWEEGETVPVAGVVTAFNNGDLVEVSLGSDDGLKPGIVMQVHRGNTYLGKITIRTTGPDRAVGQRDSRRIKVQKGDKVTGKVPGGRAEIETVSDTGFTACTFPAIVVAVGDTDLVEVSWGSDDGLKPGHVMQVYRGNQYLGQITIRTTSPDRAVGQIDKKFQRGKIQKGDKASASL